MFKKLLYLYNDGHNPFPSGRGGLGYHLPNYPKVIHGEGLSDEEDDSEEESIILPEISSEEIEEIDTTTDKGKKEIKELLKKMETIHIEPIESPSLKTITDVIKLERKHTGKKASTEGIQEMIDKVDTLVKKKETTPEPKKESGINMDELNETIEDRIDEYERAYKISLNPEDKELIRQYIKDNFMEYISKQKYKNIYIDLSEVKDAIEHFEINETPYKQTMDDILQKPKEEQQEFLNDNYESIYQYYKNLDSRPGKGYETFLCEGIGTNIIKGFVNDDNIEILNFDKSDDIPDNKKDFCVVDMLYKNPKTNKGGLGELKDYNDKDMEEYDDPNKNYVAVQAAKLCGNSYPGTNSNFDIIFGKDDDTGEYYIIDVRYKNKPISQGIEIDEYLVSVNANNNTWICDLLKQKGFVKKYINDNTMTEYPRTKGLYYVDAFKIPQTKDFVSGSKTEIPSIRIKNKYFKSQIKKK